MRQPSLEGALSTGWLALTEEEQPVAPAAARLPQWLGNRRREMRAALRELCRCFELPLGRPRRDPGVSRHNAGLGISRRDPDLRRRPNRQNPPTASRRALPQRPRLAPVLGPHGASSRTCKAGRQARSVTEAGKHAAPMHSPAYRPHGASRRQRARTTASRREQQCAGARACSRRSAQSSAKQERAWTRRRATACPVAVRRILAVVPWAGG